MNLVNMSDQPVAIVTGANRGLGLESARQLGELGYRVIITSRDARRGAAALATLTSAGVAADLRRVDVTRTDDAQALARSMAENYGAVDVLVNNAGVMIESRRNPPERSADPLAVSATTVLELFNVNTLGALRLTQALAPYLRNGARVVNVSSGMGGLAEMGSDYLGYRASKAALNALTRVMAHALAERGVLVNAVCPGWVRTDLGGTRATRSVSEGAAGIVWAATLPPDGPTGGFFRDGQPLAW